MNSDSEHGFEMPEIIIVVVFMLCISFVGMKLYETYLRNSVHSSASIRIDT